MAECTVDSYNKDINNDDDSVREESTNTRKSVALRGKVLPQKNLRRN